jgi:hypothetical protein
MSLPPIDPTGAMSSGDYVSYMLNYNNKACDSLMDQMSHYHTQDTINDWNAKWITILEDVSADVTIQETAMSKMKSQTVMLGNAIDALPS